VSLSGEISHPREHLDPTFVISDEPQVLERRENQKLQCFSPGHVCCSALVPDVKGRFSFFFNLKAMRRSSMK
jgi:hypothetical protein